MLEKWKECVAKENFFGILLTEISRVFDFLDHTSFTDKLNAYSFKLQALRLVHGNLSNRKQRINNENTYSTWMETVFGVAQGSILNYYSIPF